VIFARAASWIKAAILPVGLLLALQAILAQAQVAGSDQMVSTPASSPSAGTIPDQDVQSGQGLGRLTDITVTATRHADVVSKVPISITAFTQEALDAKGVKDFNDIARITPGVTIDSNGSNNISIRGITSSGGAATTGIYLDDTPIQMRSLGYSSDDTLPKTFDLERVEVLRGPQGTLFGAGAEGGAVRYIMAQPLLGKSEIYSRSEISFTQGGEPSYESGLAVSVPLVEDVFAVRGSIWYRHDGGWIDQMDPFTNALLASSINYTDTLSMRLAGKWAANDQIKVTPSVSYQDRRTHAVTAYWPVLSNPGANSYKTAEPMAGSQPDHYILPALKIEGDYEQIAIISNTSYYDRTEQSGYNGTLYNLGYYQQLSNPGNSSYTPLVDPAYYPLVDGSGIHLPPGLHGYVAQAPITNTQKTFAQEVRVQSNDEHAALVWTAGLFYSVNRQTSIQQIYDPMMNTLFQTLFGVSNVADIFGEGLLPNGDAYYSSTQSQDRQTALFGEATLALTPQLKVTAGLRYSVTDVTFNNFADGPQNFGTSPATRGSEHDTPVTPKLSVSYQVDAGQMLYATYAKGFRLGGVNSPVPATACDYDLGNLGLSSAPTSFKSDALNSYEVGSKSRIGEGLSIAASLYYIQWTGIQQNVFLPTCGYQFTGNLGQANSKGADLQIEYAPTQSLRLDLAIGYTDARYSADVGTPGHLLVVAGDAVSGTAFTPSPPWTIALGARFDFLVFGRKSFVRFDDQYASRSNVPTASEDPRTGSYDPFAFTPKSTNFASLRAGSTFDRWELSGFVDNLFNTHTEYPPSAYTHTAPDAYNVISQPSVLLRAYTLRPRTLGFTATYHL
jgi:outer membrane receptor protein involved in Fe transport